jgi:threonine/homoserine/homoserine lactone efflux protein
MSSTLNRGLTAGIAVAVSPLLSDAPLIAIVLLAVRTLSKTAITALSVGGGLYVIYLGVTLASWLWRSPPAPFVGQC